MKTNNTKPLAIRGHETRGREIVELLTMLGARDNNYCNGNSTKSIYYISNDGCIEFDSPDGEHTVFTLEEFLEKYPYKVRDKVLFKDTCKWNVHWIKKMEWEDNEVKYGIDYGDGFILTGIKSEDLRPYVEQEEETKTTITLECRANGKDLELVIPDELEIVVEMGRAFIKDKQPQYPETYEECCKVLSLKPERATYSVSGLEYKRCLIVNLQRLLICRDAYWKIAGNWKPDYENDEQEKHVATTVRSNVCCSNTSDCNCVLVFPSPDLRDLFLSNFKDLIESCKELL